MATLNDLKRAIIEHGEKEYIEEDLEMVEDWFDSFRKYFNAVYNHVVGSEAQRLYLQTDRINTETYQDRVIKLDSDRKLPMTLRLMRARN